MRSACRHIIKTYNFITNSLWLLSEEYFRNGWFQTFFSIRKTSFGKWQIFLISFPDTKLFIRPSSDGTYYGMVMSVRVSVRPSDSPSVRPSDSPSGLRPSVRPGLRPRVFRTFLLHALTYWAKILYMTLFWCTTEQVRVLSLCINFWRSYVMPLWNLEYRKYTVSRTFLLHALTHLAEIVHATLFWCTTEQVEVLSLFVNLWRSYASFGT